MSLIFVTKGNRFSSEVELNANQKYTEQAVVGNEYFVLDSITRETPSDLAFFRKDDSLVIQSDSESAEIEITDFATSCTAGYECYAKFDSEALGEVIVTQTEDGLVILNSGESAILPESKMVGSELFWGVGIGLGLIGGGILLNQYSDGHSNGKSSTTSDKISNGNDILVLDKSESLSGVVNAEGKDVIIRLDDANFTLFGHEEGKTELTNIEEITLAGNDNIIYIKDNPTEATGKIVIRADDTDSAKVDFADDTMWSKQGDEAINNEHFAVYHYDNNMNFTLYIEDTNAITII